MDPVSSPMRIPPPCTGPCGKFQRLLAVVCLAWGGVSPGRAGEEASLPATAGPPPAPAGLAMIANGPETVTLAWRPSPDATVTTYQIHQGDSRDGSFRKVATTPEPRVEITGLQTESPMFFKVAAVNASGAGPSSPPVSAFPMEPWRPQPFPVRVAKNMCLTLGARVVSTEKPLTGSLAALTDGSDRTSCRLRKHSEVRLELPDPAGFADAAYLMIHFRTDCSPAEWSNDRAARTVKDYVVVESFDSTDGSDGTWTEVVSGTNELLDGVIVFPNHKPRWIGLRSREDAHPEIVPAEDRRLNPRDLILARLDIFRAAPKGYRNDYWIFSGDSLVVSDMPAGGDSGRTSWFSDLVRSEHPDRYPLVVHAARGGERLDDALLRLEKSLPALSPPNETGEPTATLLCWETGFNDVGLAASPELAARMIGKYEDALAFCQANGLVMVPARIQFSSAYLDQHTLEPLKGNTFHNTLLVNLAGVDVFARSRTPYACDPKTGIPWADYWTAIRENHTTALNPKDYVHHTKEGCDLINQLWARVADRMVYRQEQEENRNAAGSPTETPALPNR